MKHLFIVAFLTAFVFGCSEKHVNSVEGEQIISNRPQTQEKYIAIVQLKTPALLENPQYDENGKLVIEAAHKGQILLEQEEVISKFKQITPDVQVVFRYRMVLNAVAVVVPKGMAGEFAKVSNVIDIREQSIFSMPMVQKLNLNQGINLELLERNSTKFIGASDAHQYLQAASEDGTSVKLRGQGIRVGIIDTGIDYTHRALGGSGKAEDFSTMDPDKTTNLFPTTKVVGGKDFTGDLYNSMSPVAENTIPKPDFNPMDRNGHGTHVAGTVAGVGDYKKTHDGIAPDALLYALKVFGAEGGTSESVVIAALEYSADPNENLDPSDRLDVVNLSLGVDNGRPHHLWVEAIKNLVNGGTMVVAAAGNANNVDFIVGAPSTADDALSVASSVDDSLHNWQFKSIAFEGIEAQSVLAKVVEGTISAPITAETALVAPLSYIGLAKEPLTEIQQADLKGKIALIDRGEIPFVDKLKLAKGGGAVGAVVVNNVPGEAIPMGGNEVIDMPAVMIPLALGDKIKEAMKAGVVSVNFGSKKLLKEPQLIDSISEFSSKGPRSLDYKLKPEISAPGSGIVSAMIGSGEEGVAFSGTSMASPQMAGAAALMRQLHPKLSPRQIKSLLMNGAMTLDDPEGRDYPVSRQGAGRVQVLKSALLPVIADTASISLGQIQLKDAASMTKPVSVTNISDKPLNISFDSASSGMTISTTDSSFELAAGETKSINVSYELDVKKIDPAKAATELDGFIKLSFSGDHVSDGFLQVPVLGFVTKMSDIDLLVSSYDPSTEELKLTYRNESDNTGDVLVFNYLGHDARKERKEALDAIRSVSCDLHSVGYRIVNKVVQEGAEPVDVVQFAVKLHTPVSTWRHCEVSIQIDKEGDGVVEQELAGIEPADIGVQAPGFFSFLFDAKKVREIRKNFEAAPMIVKEDYQPAILANGAMTTYDYSTLAIVEAPLDAIAKDAGSTTHVQIATLHNDYRAIESDDFLNDQLKKPMKISLKKEGFVGMPEKTSVDAFGNQTIALQRVGAEPASLLVYTPHNELKNLNPEGRQFQVLRIKP